MAAPSNTMVCFPATASSSKTDRSALWGIATTPAARRGRNGEATTRRFWAPYPRLRGRYVALHLHRRARAPRHGPLRPLEARRAARRDPRHRLRQPPLVPALRLDRRGRPDDRDALRDARRDAAAPLGLDTRDVRRRRERDGLRLRASRCSERVLPRGHQD